MVSTSERLTRTDNGRPGTGAPGRGELGIKERRAWRTWQLIVAIGVALLVGMAIGNAGSSPAKTSTQGGYAPPPPAGSQGSAGSTTSVAASPSTSAPDSGSAGGSASGSPTTSPVTTSTAASSATGPVQVLLPEKQARGTWTSTPFTVGGGQWNIGWAYQCVPAPTSGPAFQVFVVPTGASAGTTPATNETAASGSGVTPQTTAGSQELQVVAPSSCIWAVKVTGIA